MCASFSRSDLHIRRRLFHILSGTLLTGTYWSVIPDPAKFGPAVSLFAILFVLVDLFRLKTKRLNRALSEQFEGLMRVHEDRQLSGASFYLIGVAISVLFFPKPFALLAMMFLAFADPLAAVVGTVFGRLKIHSNASAAGTIMSFAVCLLITILAIEAKVIVTQQPVIIAIAGGVIGAVVEALPIPIDDNLTLPVLSGALMWAIHSYVG